MGTNVSTFQSLLLCYSSCLALGSTKNHAYEYHTHFFTCLGGSKAKRHLVKLNPFRAQSQTAKPEVGTSNASLGSKSAREKGILGGKPPVEEKEKGSTCILGDISRL